MEQAGGSARQPATVNNRIRAAFARGAKRAGLSQAEVAARLGSDRLRVCVELGTENITLSACVRFAQAVGCLFSPEFTPPEPHDSASGFAEFGRHLREARRRAGLSQDALAARLGMTQGYVSRVERGAQNITLSACEVFAAAVGCTFSTMLTPKPRDRNNRSAKP